MPLLLQLPWTGNIADNKNILFAEDVLSARPSGYNPSGAERSRAKRVPKEGIEPSFPEGTRF